MNNWLLIIVITIVIVCIVVGYVRGFLKLGLSLLSTILTLVIVLFLSPYVADALAKYTPVDDYIEAGLVEAFMPEITPEDLKDGAVETDVGIADAAVAAGRPVA